MADHFQIKQNDTRPLWVLSLQVNSVALNLTGAASAKLIAKPQGGGSNVLPTTAIMSPASAGQVQVTFSAANTATVGVYDCEIEVTWSAGLIQTLPNEAYFLMEVTDDLG